MKQPQHIIDYLQAKWKRESWFNAVVIWITHLASDTVLHYIHKFVWRAK